MLTNDINYRKARAMVLRWLSYRQRSRRETETYLKSKGLEDAVVDGVLTEMADYGYIDDIKFTEEFLQGSLRRGFGPRRARLELLNKGVDANLVEEGLKRFFNPEDDYLRAKDLLGKRHGLSVKMSEKEIRKNAAFLSRRGFHDEVIRKVLNFTKNNYCDNDSESFS